MEPCVDWRRAEFVGEPGGFRVGKCEIELVGKIDYLNFFTL